MLPEKLVQLLREHFRLFHFLSQSTFSKEMAGFHQMSLFGVTFGDDVASIRAKLKDKTLTLEQFLSYRATNNLILRADRLAIELYALFLTPALDNTLRNC